MPAPRKPRATTRKTPAKAVTPATPSPASFSTVVTPTVAPAPPRRPRNVTSTRALDDPSRLIDYAAKGDMLTLDVKAAEATTEGQARDILTSRGLDPAVYEVTGYRESEWTMGNGELGLSTRFTFAKRAVGAADAAAVITDRLADRLAARAARTAAPTLIRPTKSTKTKDAFVVLLGDMQFGKADGDGAEGAFTRAIAALDAAAAELHARLAAGERFSNIAVIFLGDHVEGFISQGGANALRTPLGLADQVLLASETMWAAVERFNIGLNLSLIAVPGNHGDTMRNPVGSLSYSDSFDTLALRTVEQAARRHPSAYKNVRFFTPECDSLEVHVALGGTNVTAIHGHQLPSGNQGVWKWWQGQCGGDLPAGNSSILVAGHKHHAHLEVVNRHRTFVQAPALEHHSAWFRNKTGVDGTPGILTAVLHDRQVEQMRIHHSAWAPTVTGSARRAA